MEQEFEMKYGVIVLSKKNADMGDFEILHFAGFESKPSLEEIEHIRQESLFDDQFRLAETYEPDDLYAEICDEETLETYKQILKELLIEESGE